MHIYVEYTQNNTMSWNEFKTKRNRTPNKDSDKTWNAKFDSEKNSSTNNEMTYR